MGATLTEPVGPQARSCPQILVALPQSQGPLVMPAMSTKSRQVIYGGRIIGAKIRAEGARKRAAEAIREADRAEAEEAYGGPAHPAPNTRQRPNGGLVPFASQTRVRRK